MLFTVAVNIQMAKRSSPREPDTVTIEAFNHNFEGILRGHAQNLKTLEIEGAIYSEFADRDESGEFLGTFTRYRVKFTPAEIVEYVQAHIAAQEFREGRRRTRDFTAAVLSIREPRFRERVTSYGQYGRSRNANGDVDDIRGCFASFLSPELEGLVCGAERDRYEPLPPPGSDSNKNELVVSYGSCSSL